jgi:hypothetical protein
LHTAPAAVSAIPRVPLQEFYETSPSQKNFWMHSQFEESAFACNMAFSYTLLGDLNIEAFQCAVSTAYQRHEILRTNYKLLRDEVVQFVLDYESSMQYLNYEDHTSSSEDKKTLLRGYYDATILDLEKDRLFQCSLFRVKEHEFIFTFIIHHILADEWSLLTLQKEIITLYNAYCDGLTPSLPSLKIQYKDYSAWLNKFLSKEKNVLRSFWKDHLKGELLRTTFNPDYPRSSQKTYKGSSLSFSLEPENIAMFRERCLEKNSTFFTGCMSVIKLLLYNSCKHEKVIIGITLSDRSNTDLENQIGNYLNAIPVVSEIDPSSLFENFLEREKELMASVIKHRAYPFDQIVADVNAPREHGRTPLFDVQVTWHTFGAEQDLSENMKDIVQVLPERNLNGVLFDILLVGNEEAKTFTIDYNSDLYHPDTIRKIGDDFSKVVALLKNSLAHPVTDILDQIRDEDVKNHLAFLEDKSLRAITEEF